MPKRLELDGEYDLARLAEVRDIFEAVDERAVVIDFGTVTYVDSLFLQEMIKLHRRLPSGAVTLVNVDNNIRRLLELMGLDQMFTIVS